MGLLKPTEDRAAAPLKVWPMASISLRAGWAFDRRDLNGTTRFTARLENTGP